MVCTSLSWAAELREQAEKQATELQEALGTLAEERLVPLEESTRGVSKRVDDVESALDLRLLEMDTTLTQKIEDAVSRCALYVCTRTLPSVAVAVSV